MKYGYKFLIALTLAAAAIIKTKAQNSSSQNNNACLTSALVEHPNIEEDLPKEPEKINVSSDNFAEVMFAQINNEEKADKEEKIPWEKTSVGTEMVETWIRMQESQGVHNPIMPTDIEYLRKINETNHKVEALAVGLNDYVMDGEDMLRANADSLSLALEKSAKLEANGSGGDCYKWVKHVLCGTNPIAFLEGKPAWMGADGLRKSPNVVATHTTYEHMDKLIPGGIGVFGRGWGASNGHILIGGKGRQDLIKHHVTSLGKEYWYNPARDISDVDRNANTSGRRGSSGRYAPKPEIFLTKGSTVAGVTILKVGYNYAKKHISKMYITPHDVYNAVLQINNKSAEQTAQKIIAEKARVNGFVEAKGKTAYHGYPAPRVENPRGVRFTKAITPTTQQILNRIRGGHRKT